LRRAIYLVPYQDEPHLLLARLYQRGGRLTAAIEEFKVAIWCRETPAARVAHPRTEHFAPLFVSMMLPGFISR